MRKIASAKPETRSAVVSRERAVAFPGQMSSPGRLSWSLPSGESLAEFALRLGFLAPPLLGSKGGRVTDRGRVGFREAR